MDGAGLWPHTLPLPHPNPAVCRVGIAISLDLQGMLGKWQGCRGVETWVVHQHAP